MLRIAKDFAGERLVKVAQFGQHKQKLPPFRICFLKTFKSLDILFINYSEFLPDHLDLSTDQLISYLSKSGKVFEIFLKHR